MGIPHLAPSPIQKSLQSTTGHSLPNRTAHPPTKQRAIREPNATLLNPPQRIPGPPIALPENRDRQARTWRVLHGEQHSVPPCITGVGIYSVHGRSADSATDRGCAGG